MSRKPQAIRLQFRAFVVFSFQHLRVSDPADEGVNGLRIHTSVLAFAELKMHLSKRLTTLCDLSISTGRNASEISQLASSIRHHAASKMIPRKIQRRRDKAGFFETPADRDSGPLTTPT